MEINQCVGDDVLAPERNRHRHAIEQASRRWRANAPYNLSSTQVEMGSRGRRDAAR